MDYGAGQPPYPNPPMTGQPQTVVYVPPAAGAPAGQVIQMQPVPYAIGPNPHVPPGLEYLTTLDRLFVKQKVELLEAFVGFETNNKYTIKSATGHNAFFAVEDVDCCTRNCCGNLRPTDFKIMDANQREVIHVERPCRCDSCCCPCCLQKVTVSSPPGSVVGYVKQEWSLCKPCFRIEDASGETVLLIRGPCITCSCKCGSVEFRVLSRDGEVEVGRISKEWSGLAREYFTDAESFGISFPMDLDVKLKAVMLGACLLIDFMYFEDSKEGAACQFCDILKAFR